MAFPSSPGHVGETVKLNERLTACCEPVHVGSAWRMRGKEAVRKPRWRYLGSTVEGGCSKKKKKPHCLLRRIHSVTVHCFPGVDESLVGGRQETKVNSSEGNILTSRILSKRIGSIFILTVKTVHPLIISLAIKSLIVWLRKHLFKTVALCWIKNRFCP